MVKLKRTQLILQQTIYDAGSLSLVFAGIKLEQLVAKEYLLSLPGVLEFLGGGEF